MNHNFQTNRKLTILLVITLSLLITIGLATAEKTGKGSKLYSGDEWFNVNNCQMPVTNYGEFGYMYGFWPKGSGEAYIFGSGIWIGGIKGGQRLVSCGYNTYGAGNDFIPGPPVNAGDHYLNPNSHPEDRVLVSTNSEDLDLWPYRDSLNEPVILGDQDMWCEYNDTWADRHSWDPGTGPLGLHVRQLTFGWTTKLYVNMVFFLYEIENVGDERIENMYVGMGSDMDVGYADDDLTGCDVGRSLGYTYTLSQEDGWSSRPPYYVGVKFLQGPKSDDTVYVPAPPGPENPDYPNAVMDTVLPGEHLVLTSFTRCTREKGGDPENDAERYEMLAGYNIETHDYDPWQGVADEVPADKRQVMGCGPFSLSPGEVDTFLVGIMFSNGGTGGLEYLQSEGDAALTAYLAGWVVPSPPPSPALSVIPGDQKIALVWDNSAEFTPDPFSKVMEEAGDTVYRQFDFEGYRLWKSRTGLPEEWDLLGQWDLENEITILPGDFWIRNDDYPDGFNINGTSSNNSGLVYSYMDRDVMNGITYFYSITSYDYNTPGAVPNEENIYTSLESGIDPVTAAPRAEPANFDYPTASAINQVSGNCNTLSALEVEIIGDIEVTGHEYTLEWKDIQIGSSNLPVYTYNIYDETTSRYISIGDFQVPTISGVTVSVESSDSNVLADSIISSGEDTVFFLRKTEWETVYYDSLWSWFGYFNKPFDGLVVSGSLSVAQARHQVSYQEVLRNTYRATTNDYGIWTDTVLVSSSKVMNTLVDSVVVDSIIPPDTFTTTYYKDYYTTPFGMPDSLVIIEDGATEYTGNLALFPSFQSVWAYHGGLDLEIRWNYYNGHEDTLTMQVLDVLTGEEVPYDSAFGDNWCFGFGSAPARCFITGTQPPPYRIWFYVCGMKYYFNQPAPMNWAARPEQGDIWRIYSSANTIPPVKGNLYTFSTEAPGYLSEGNLDLIKVVPNPYVIRADWDRSKNTRKIQFTHLPQECTIRIYNLAGDLVRTLEHFATIEDGGVEEWDIRTEDDQIPASGVYIYYLSTPGGQEKTGKFSIIR
ncbi:hypothetical protein JW877_04625 [bacterium]|nr:hypothetical protein [bacterium]